MSLATPEKPPQYPVAILASKNFDDPSFLEEVVGASILNVSHVYTNGANKLVADFAACNGLPCTVFPLTHSNLLKSTGLIIEQVAFVYIISTLDSKSAAIIEDLCVKASRKFKVIPYEPYGHWCEKVCKVNEILDAMPKEELEKDGWAKAARRVLTS